MTITERGNSKFVDALYRARVITKKVDEWRPQPYPCYIIYERTSVYLFGVLIKRTLKKIK